ncbi:MAG: LacI family DNA-binding transcriptional regulator [Chloroflexota bacterium]
MITIKDVAKRAKVSTTTVSYAFNQPQRVRDETRQRVLAAAAALGFQPNLHASGLRSHQTGIVGIIVSDIRVYYSAVIARGIQERLLQANKTGLIANTDGSQEKTRAVIQKLRQQGVRAFIFSPVPSRYDEETLLLFHQMQKEGIPLAFVTNEMASFPADMVLWHAQEGVKRIVMHLVEQGHQKIGVARLKLGSHMSGVKRWLGFQEGIIEANLLLHSDYIFEGELNFESGVRAIDYFRQLAAPPTAIVAIDDVIASGIMNRCFHLGVRIPRDLSIVGVGNTPTAQHLSPSLTTVGVNMEAMGRKSAELLLERLKNPELPPRKPFLDYELVIRESVSLPKAT